nr:SOS response-associated peptidase family protein [Haladaptatus paucihalophilus]
MKPIHNRMPVVLSSEDKDRWLSGDPEEREALCQPYSRDDLAAYEISTRVNNPVMTIRRSLIQRITNNRDLVSSPRSE